MSLMNRVQVGGQIIVLSAAPMMMMMIVAVSMTVALGELIIIVRVVSFGGVVELLVSFWRYKQVSPSFCIKAFRRNAPWCFAFWRSMKSS